MITGVATTQAERLKYARRARRQAGLRHERLETAAMENIRGASVTCTGQCNRGRACISGMSAIGSHAHSGKLSVPKPPQFQVLEQDLTDSITILIAQRQE